MSLKKKFGTNKTDVEQGAWVDICENDDGSTCRIRVKRMNQQNPKFQKEIANHRNAFSGDFFTANKVTQMTASMIEVLISTVIVGWENVQDWTVETQPGEPAVFLPFTPDNVRKVLVEFPDLLDLVTAQATDITTFQHKEEEAKN